MEHSYASVVAAQRIVQASALRNERHVLHKHLIVLFVVVATDSLSRQVLPTACAFGVVFSLKKSQRRMRLPIGVTFLAQIV